MCGIAGMVGRLADAGTVGRMTAVQKHRGPDGEGLWTEPGIALGHRRLKIIDLSEAGRQPMSTPDGRYTIVYNGEVYNYRELKKELAEVAFRSETDTEVVLQAYARWGPDCLQRFVGMYGFAIWDARQKELFCARDRLGIKPLYYTAVDGTFVFASEIKGILEAGVPRCVNPHVLYDFLARDFYDHTEETFFSGIRNVPPASWMVVRDGKASTPQQYWNLGAEAGRLSVEGNPTTREERLLGLYEDVVRLHLRSDVPVGVALSGGLDSATLLVLLDRTHPDPRRVEAFSFSFSDPRYSERPYVEMMARATARPAHFAEVSPRLFADEAEQVAAVQEEPFAGAPISAYARCIELGRRNGFIVMMDGSGVDEALAGYERFKPALWADLFLAGDWDSLDRELTASGVSGREDRRMALARMQAAASPQGDEGKGQDLTASVRADCLDAGFGEAARTGYPSFERPFSDHLRNLMFRELRYTKLPRALRFRDRLSMAAGVELRPPFLDHRLLEYQFALPWHDRIYGGTSKAILRRMAERWLPDAVRLAAKRSVQTPQREWFRNELKEWVRERVDTPSFWNRHWVDRRKGARAMEAFFRGEGDNSFFLWQWINLELWARRYLTS